MRVAKARSAELPPAETWMEPTPTDRFGQPIAVAHLAPVTMQTPDVKQQLAEPSIDTAIGDPAGQSVLYEPPAEAQDLSISSTSEATHPLVDTFAYEQMIPPSAPAETSNVRIQPLPATHGIPDSWLAAAAEAEGRTYVPGAANNEQSQPFANTAHSDNPYTVVSAAPGEEKSFEFKSIRVAIPVILSAAVLFVVGMMIRGRYADTWVTCAIVIGALLACHLFLSGWAFVAHGSAWGKRVFRSGWVGVNELCAAIGAGTTRNRQPPVWPVVAVLALLLAFVVFSWLGGTPRRRLSASSDTPISQNVTVEASEGATYDPDKVGSAIAGGSILPEEAPFRSECKIDGIWHFEDTRTISDVRQTCAYGSIEYWVYGSDVEAAESMLFESAGGLPVLQQHGSYPTNSFFNDDGSLYFVVAVGNVVVAGFVPLDSGDFSEREIANMNTAVYAANLAELGVSRLIRVTGYAP